MRACISSALFVLAWPAVAADWFVSPSGSGANAGTREAPWEISAALDGSRKIAPGDTLWLLAGTYKRRPKEQFEVRLAGSEAQPICIRGEAGKRVTIDGGLAIQDPSMHVWVRDLELIVSEAQPERPVPAGSHPEDFKRPWGGLHVFGGKHCKFINLVIHECRQGVSWWKGSTDSELYGCVIYENGWAGVDRGHGHCIYTQNKDGIKRIAHCILTCKLPGQQTLQAYGSKNADVENYLCEENIAYGLGRFLIGGGRPSKNIRVYRNHFYKVDLQLGYTAPENEDCDVQGNRVFRGTISIQKFKNAKQEGNWIWNPAEPLKKVEVFVMPNAYEAGRANVVVYNGSNEAAAVLPVSAVLEGRRALCDLRPEKSVRRPALRRGGRRRPCAVSDTE